MAEVGFAVGFDVVLVVVGFVVRGLAVVVVGGTYGGTGFGGARWPATQ